MAKLEAAEGATDEEISRVAVAIWDPPHAADVAHIERALMEGEAARALIALRVSGDGFGLSATF
jgi:hypothetical protein